MVIHYGSLSMLIQCLTYNFEDDTRLRLLFPKINPRETIKERMKKKKKKSYNSKTTQLRSS